MRPARIRPKGSTTRQSQMDELSYILTRRDGDKTTYWKNGSLGGWTADISDARLYAKKASANQARIKIVKRPDVNEKHLTVEDRRA